MKNNTAIAASAHTVVKEFKDAHGSMDMLKVFLVTGATDISKSYEMISKWAKEASNDADKAKFRSALKSLQDIELKRIELTCLMYNAQSTVTSEPEAKTFLMLPKLDDVLERVRKILEDGANSTDSFKESLAILKETVGEGKVQDVDGNAVTWDTDQINAFFGAIEEKDKTAEAVENKKSEPGENVGFDTLMSFATDLVKHGKDETEIKASVKQFINGRIIHSNSGDFLVKDDKVFEDYWKRIFHAVVGHAISEKKKADGNKNKDAALNERIEKEVKPFLANLDKDETQKDMAGPTRLLFSIFKSADAQYSLQDALNKAVELAKSVAPGLFKRYTESKKETKPINPAAVVKTDNPDTEIYDDSHNIKESNKALWKEVEGYVLLGQIFDKATELTKANNWQDALSMCLLLIASGKINETPDSVDPIKWDETQVKSWFNTNILVAAEAIDTEKKPATEVDKKLTGDAGIVGPVPPAGFTEEVKEKVTKLIKGREELAKKYKFKSFQVAVERRIDPFLSFEVIDGEPEDKDFLGTEANLIKFIDGIRDELLKNANVYPLMKIKLHDTLTPLYEVSNGEIKSLLDTLSHEAGKLRKEAKKSMVNGKLPDKPGEAPAAESGSTPPAAAVDTSVSKTTKDSGTASDNKVNPIPLPVVDVAKTVDTTKDTTGSAAETIEEEDEEGTMYYDKLEVGEVVEEMINGKRVAEPDGAYTFETEDGDVGVEIKDGKIFSINSDLSETDESAETETPAITTAVAPLPVAPVVDVKKDTSSQSQNLGEEASSTKNTAGEASTNSNKPDYTGFEDIVKAERKLPFDIAIYEKVISYPKREDGEKAVFDVIDALRKDHHYKKAFARNYKGSQKVDILAVIKKAVDTGIEKAKQK